MDRSKADPVASGAAYVVLTVNGQNPGGLHDLVSGGVVIVEISRLDQTVVIHGSTRHDDEAVVLYEKDQGGLGKDVRSWEITVGDGCLRATMRAAS